MFEIGKTFKRGNNTFCLLKLFDYNSKRYGFFSIENDKISFVFYEIIEKVNSYDLREVEDDNLINVFLSIVESEMN